MDRSKLHNCLNQLANEGLLTTTEDDGDITYELSNRGAMRADHILAQRSEAQFFLLNYLVRQRLNDGDTYNELVACLMELAETFRDRFAINILRTLIEHDKVVAGFNPSVFPEDVIKLYDPDQSN